MSKKKLLEESTIRSFMKLANLQPLTAKFLKESEEEKAEDEEEDEEEKKEEDLDESTAPPDTEASAHERDRMEEEVVEEEGEQLEETVSEESAEGAAEHKSADKATKKVGQPKGKSLTPKATQGIDGAKTVKSPGKLKPLKAGTHHSDKPDSIETKNKSNEPKKNNSTHEIHESLEEMEMEEEAPEVGGEEMGSAGESGDHQQKMKDLIRGMLDTLKNMGAEYGMSMEISDDSGEPGEEEPGQPEEPGEAGEMEPSEEPEAGEALEEMVERLTKRVAARLVKETKKKR